MGQSAQPVLVTTELRGAANTAFQQQDWNAAVLAYEKIVAAEGSNVGARYRYGLSLLGATRHAEAVVQLEQVFAASPNPVFGLALARAYVRHGHKARAYETLEASIALGGISPDTLNGEADFASIRTEARFVELAERHDRALNPCKASPSFREFDFWIGEWTAMNPQGVTVGSSSIQLILGHCVIFENWSTPVSSGKSVNIFSADDHKWHQTWVDDRGALMQYSGGLVDGRMVLDAETTVEGRRALARLSFSRLPNGDVRQHGERSFDGGRTWTSTFEMHYTRKK